jgi:hypothetical protein
LLLGYLLSRALGDRALLPLLGCGCTPGPAARSLPAAAATWLIFGPATAAARLGAALAVAFAFGPLSRAHPEEHGKGGLLSDLQSLLPSALLAGAAIQLSAWVEPAKFSPALQLAAGALLGFVSSPCALGAVAVAAAFHARAPLTADAYLCVAGIVDVRALARRRERGRGSHDAFSYVLLALALGIVAGRHGAELVHPAIAPALAIGCAAVVAFGARHRTSQTAGLRFAPALMFASALLTAPPPRYHATETTLGDLFPGERLSFMGALSREAGNAALVRYAITCCRADAAPVVIRLTSVPPYSAGTWLRIDGVIETRDGASRLSAQRVVRVAPPADPFVYR